MIAKVTIDIAHNAVDQSYDYIVPKIFETTIQTGMRIEVPFANGIRSGIITGFKKTSSRKDLKEVKALLDDVPILSDVMLEAALRMKKKYAIPLFEFIHLLIPDFKRFKKTKKLLLKNESETYNSYFKGKKEIPYPKKLDATLKKGIENGSLEVLFTYKEKGTLKSETYYRLTQKEAPLNDSQKAVVDYLKTHGQATKKTLKEALFISDSPVQTLLKNEVISSFKVPTYLSESFQTKKSDLLSPMDEAVMQKLLNQLQGHSKVIFTGDKGKNLSHIASFLASHQSFKRVIYVLPEIPMVSQMAFKMKEFMDVTVYHSKMSASEKKDSYERFLKGAVCITTPSGSFLDLENTDLMIIDEAQDASYQSLDRPRFDLLKDGDLLEDLFSFKRLYVTQTVPVELSFFKEETLDLNQAFDPFDYEIADLKTHVVNHPNKMITVLLHKHIEHTLEDNKNVLLIHNQKGAFRKLKCFQCGLLARCHHCLNPLTIKNNRPYCETCGIFQEADVCETCKKPYQAYDPGIDVLKEEVLNHYPVAVTLLDQDTKDFLDLVNSKITPRVIIGTQMVMRNLTFTNIGLVGIIQLEDLVYGLEYSDAWAKMTAIIHASERLNTGKKVVIQTFEQRSRVLNYLNQPKDFFEKELDTLKKLNLPPFKDLAQIVLKGDKNKRHYLSSNMIQYLKKAFRDHVELLGPLHHPNHSIISLKSDDLKNYYGTLNTLVKSFSDEIELDIRHFKFKK